VTRLLVAVVVVVSLCGAAAKAADRPYRSTVVPLPATLRSQLPGESWRTGCPVPLSRLRVLTVTHWGFDGRPHTGRLVVHQDVARGLARVFERLYELRFPIRHMQLGDMYGPVGARPSDGDVTGSFRCRQAVPSPCTGGSANGSWSNHAYGHAIDLNPVENPYVGCGRTREAASARYLDRSRLRKGMVSPAVIAAFRSIGWGWGGSWSGDTKDYMHFSTTGH
jgi:hypothetical protein